MSDFHPEEKYTEKHPNSHTATSDAKIGLALDSQRLLQSDVDRMEYLTARKY